MTIEKKNKNEKKTEKGVGDHFKYWKDVVAYFVVDEKHCNK